MVKLSNAIIDHQNKAKKERALSIRCHDENARMGHIKSAEEHQRYADWLSDAFRAKYQLQRTEKVIDGFKNEFCIADCIFNDGFCYCIEPDDCKKRMMNFIENGDDTEDDSE